MIQYLIGMYIDTTNDHKVTPFGCNTKINERVYRSPKYNYQRCFMDGRQWKIFLIKNAIIAADGWNWFKIRKTLVGSINNAIY